MSKVSYYFRLGLYNLMPRGDCCRTQHVFWDWFEATDAFIVISDEGLTQAQIMNVFGERTHAQIWCKI